MKASKWLSQLLPRLFWGRLSLLIAVAIGLGCSTISSFAASNLWAVKAEMPTTRGGVHAINLGGKIYLIGGCNFIPGESIEKCVLPTVEQYDPAHDRWTKKAGMAVPRVFLATAAVNGKIYAFGGSGQLVVGAEALAAVEEYDPATDTWSRKADMPIPRADLTASVVDGKIYLIGGTRHVGVDALATVEVYDPANDSWEVAPEMPTPRLHLTSAVVDSKIYVFGGSPREWPVPSAIVEAYDPAKRVWEKKADMPTERSGLWTSAVDGRIYASGGVDWDGEALATVEEYNPQTNSWRPRADMPTPRLLLATEAAGGKVYAFGGWTTDYVSLNTAEVYSP